MRDLIDQLKDCEVIQNGEFTLKSGKKSKIYIDMRKVISFPDVHEFICNKLIQKIKRDKIDLICGTPYGAVPYTSYISINQKIPMIFLRKEEKKHGKKKLVEGNYKNGERVLLIEDVTTSGGSVSEAAYMLEQQGLKVTQILAIVSRNPIREIYFKDVLIESLIHIDEILKPTLKDLIKEKSKICFAADVTTMKELEHLVNEVGDKICILKIHSDIIEDFYDDFTKNCNQLQIYKEKYNFRIWEDRKLADIGIIMQRQINIIKKWADIVSVHPISGMESIQNIKGIDMIFIVELSTSGNLMSHNYKMGVIDILYKCKNVIGVVSQSKICDNIIHFVPGISLNSEKDNMGQRYNKPSDKKWADIFVIGRGIYKDPSPRDAINKYLSLL